MSRPEVLVLSFLEQTNQMLNRPARRLAVEELASDKTQRQIDEMLAFASGQTRPEGEGRGKRLVGLAAPQVGIDAAIILFDVVRNDEWTGNLDVLVNPMITGMYGDTTRWWHGCFSTTPICGVLELPGTMDVVGLDRHGNGVERTYTGRFQTHVLWHEIRHIDGLRFPDEVLAQGGQLATVYSGEYAEFDLDKPWRRPAPTAAWTAMKAGLPWENLL